MEIYSLVFLGLFLAAIGYITLLQRKTGAQSKAEGSVFSLIKQDLESIKNEVKESSESNLGFLQDQLKEGRVSAQQQIQESSRLIEKITKEISALTSTNQQVVSVAEQLRGLEDILKNPKQRGILGEYTLETLLKGGFTPKNYQMQYAFKDGQIVDAVLFLADKIIPIDSKFSLENYNRIVVEKDQTKKEQLEKVFKQDLKNRIDETAKYIRPEEGTFDFALMFIPAEGIYYDLMVNEVGAVKSNTRDLLEYAVWEKNVHIVSPNSFYAYLQTILQGLKAFEIEKSAKDIISNVSVLRKHLLGFDEYMQKLGGHLGTACNTYNLAYKELNKIDKDVVKITGQERQIEPLTIDKPDKIE
ncbi:DNA recombination protein RmuC [Candidatus Parcubacteria bacterium]|nr:DNA recombination protein RmuC [Candidatus Parcubacteria bacterium]